MVMDMDPAFLRVGGFALYWYGAVYTFGFLGTLVWLLARRAIGRTGVSALCLAAEGRIKTARASR